jgi:formylglycine-generating enzyme required for sulfatase activity
MPTPLASPTPTATPLPTPTPSGTFVNSLGMRFNQIPAGSFLMGSPPEEGGRFPHETQHPVTLTQSFYLQTTEVTFGQWEQVMGYSTVTAYATDPQTAVYNISWDDTQAFIQALKTQGRGNCRLPTEAEWEYAARAGSTTAWACGNNCASQLGWHKYNSLEYQHRVAQKPPNAWGLYDMHGNLAEWVQDLYGGDYGSAAQIDPTGASSGFWHLYRGGAWSSEPEFTRSASREINGASSPEDFSGFRLVCQPGT